MRGTTSFGFYRPVQNKLVHNVKETRIKTLLKRTKGENTEVLFHHRWSTSTIDVRNACHPFSTKDMFGNNYVGVHNGVLNNDDKLKKMHDKLGITYVSMQENGTFNDSEALVYELARYFEGEIDTMGAEGTIAFIVVKNNAQGKPVMLYFGTNRGELKMKLTENSLTISSEGDGVQIPNETLYMWDYENKELRTAPMSIKKGYNYSGKYCYTPKSYTYNSPASTTFGNKSDNFDDYEDDRWDRYWEDLGGQSDSEADRQFIRDYAKDTFVDIRDGDVLKLKGDFLRENKGSFKMAAIAATNEFESVLAEMRVINYDTEDAYNDDDKAQIEDLIEYYSCLDEYSKVLLDVAHALNEGDKRISSAREARVSKGQMGFHLPSTTEGKVITDLHDMAETIENQKILMGGNDGKKL